MPNQSFSQKVFHEILDHRTDTGDDYISPVTVKMFFHAQNEYIKIPKYQRTRYKMHFFQNLILS